MVEANKRAVQDAIDSFNNFHDRSGYFRMYDEKCVVHGLPPGLSPDIAGLTQFYEGLWRAFPDIKISVEALFGEKDSVAVRFLANGTHAEDFFDHKANGNHATFYVILHLVFRDERVVHRWSQLTMIEEPIQA